MATDVGVCWVPDRFGARFVKNKISTRWLAVIFDCVAQKREKNQQQIVEILWACTILMRMQIDLHSQHQY